MSSTAPVVDIPTSELNKWFDQRFTEKMEEREVKQIISLQ